MKFTNVLPLAALTSAYVISSEQVLGEVAIEDHHGHRGVDGWLESASATKDELMKEVEATLEEVSETGRDAWSKIHNCGKQAKSAMDAAFERASEDISSFGKSVQDAAHDVESWWEDSDVLESLEGGHHRPGHGKKPHHPPHHKPNETVYQLIAGSKYTTKLAELISEYDDIVELLNSTSAGNFTVFAPTDKAFAKVPEDAPKPSKQVLKAILAYHVIPDFYPAGRVLVSHTAPTLFKTKELSDHEEPQRMTFRIGLNGLSVNFYSRIVAINIFGTNGVIHGVDSVILPPPSAIKSIDLFPGEFSTLELGLGKTGLLERLNTTRGEGRGGTFFAPSNFAFQKLGPRINAFLFSEYGRKYLKALLEYHVVPYHTLYSDAYYKPKGEGKSMNVPKGLFHVNLPTMLKDRELSIDVARYGGFISIKVNGFASVSVLDGVAENGVIHVMRDVLIPPKQLAGVEEQWDGSELTVEELKERLEPFVPKTDL
ncbi:Aurofusarin biosynthesis cluster protein S [Pseudocercospora fuligena]|uniref:Aurofusarin biosynthesis cluster protein S n=1 Tax=Pseudocercospora fuligena TaxID=685502 RepID=A0A8H6RGI6_9PEZI|nr:Aurofusarin biosynthesis cluster protein S [Pseudocercospora fuligena]